MDTMNQPFRDSPCPPEGRGPRPPRLYQAGADFVLFLVWFRMEQPRVRAWLRLLLDPTRRGPMPPPPDTLRSLVGHLDHLVMPCPEARATLARMLAEIERLSRERVSQLDPRDRVARDDLIAHIDLWTIEQILQGDSAARAWLRYVVDTDVPTPRRLPPPGLVAFANAVDVIQRRPDGRVRLRAVLVRAERRSMADFLAAHWFAASRISAPSTLSASPPPRPPEESRAILRIQLAHEVEGMVLVLALLMGQPRVRAWLRLVLSHPEGGPLPAPPESIPALVGDIPLLLTLYPKKRAALVDVLEQAERFHRAIEAPPAYADEKVCHQDADAGTDEAVVEQLLKSHPAALAWLRRVVETDASAPLPAPPANLGYFAEAVDVIRAHVDGRALLRVVVERAERANHVDVIAMHEVVPRVMTSAEEIAVRHVAIEHAERQDHGDRIAAHEVGRPSFPARTLHDEASEGDDCAALRSSCGASAVADGGTPAAATSDRRPDARASGPRTSRRRLVPRTLVTRTMLMSAS